MSQNGKLQKEQPLPFKDILNLFTPPQPEEINTKTFIKNLEITLNTEISIDCDIQLEKLFIDNHIITFCLFLFFKQKMNSNMFSLIYQEREEAGFLIPMIRGIATTEINDKYILLNDLLPLPIDFLNDIWTSATNGGKIIIESNCILFKLSGFKIKPPQNETFMEFIKTVDDSEKKGDNEWLTVYNPKKLLDIQTSFTNIWQTFRNLIHNAKSIEIQIDPLTPVFWAPELTLLCCITCSLLPFTAYRRISAGVFSILYDKQKKCFYIETVIETEDPLQEKLNLIDTTTLIIKQLYGELSINTQQKKNKHTLTQTIVIPDPTATILDKEIEGWEFLSQESIDLLRRLCSHQDTLKEHPFIPEIVRHETEIFFTQLFSKTIFQNLSHEIIEMGGANPKTKSLLEQIKKGKLKKNSLEPEVVSNLIKIFLNSSNGRERIKNVMKKTDISINLLSKLSELLKDFPASPVITLKQLALVIKDFNIQN